MSAPRSPAAASGRRTGLLGTAGLLLALLLFLFAGTLQRNHVLFSSDGPLGANTAACNALPEAFRGVWVDLNWLGSGGGSAFPSLTYFLLWVLQPVLFAKFYAPLCLLVLGLSVWLCFRTLGFRPIVCALGAAAAALNTDFFSYACWGLGTLPLAVAGAFLAVAALSASCARAPWVRPVLAGLAVGWSVMEGFDSGAILSLYVAAFVVFQVWAAPGTPGAKALRSGLRVAVVAACAAWLAAQTLSVLIGTQIQGVVGMQQQDKTQAQQWDWATQWSLPKIEALRIVVPGLFGYRMDTEDGGEYWGGVGRDPQWPRRGYIRHSGAGFYAGQLVCLLAAFGVAMSFARRKPLYSPEERRFIWFWAGVALLSLLFSFGRHAPFYQFLYALPYLSTIRNPIKYLHPFHLALVILFGYGLQGLVRGYLEAAGARGASIKDGWRQWWAGATVAERRWVFGSGACFGLGAIATLLYSASRKEMIQYLQSVGFAADRAPAIFGFSVREAFIFLVFLAVSLWLLALIFSRWLSGPRARWGGALLGGVLLLDLLRANAPWVVHYDYTQKYATNPVIDFLRQTPHLQRVTAPPLPVPPEVQYFPMVCNEWLQHHFQYYNVQSLDVIQMPRVSEEYSDYNAALGASPARLWQLTSTRYLLALAPLVDVLNREADPVQQRFRLHTPFVLANAARGGITAETNTTGPFGVIEFTGALPRAKLYAQWQVLTNPATVLSQLATPSFDPQQRVIVEQDVPLPPPGATNVPPGTVEYVEYAPKHIELKTQAEYPALLLLNDRYDPGWKVWVDDRPAPLLRCNYLMRGVHLPPGAHRVTFRYVPPATMLLVSLSALGAGLLVLGYGAWSARRPPSGSTASVPGAP